MSRINTNVSANNAYRNLSVVSGGLEKSIQKLSSGFRINKSSDDAAGLSIANKLRAEARSMQQAARNAAQGSAVLQVADGAVTTVSNILDRMKELAAQSASGNVSDGDRAKINAEFGQLRSEIDRIAGTTEYQGAKLVNGTFGASVDLASGTLDGVASVAKINYEGATAGTYTFTDTAGSIAATFTRGGVAYSETVTKAAGAGVAKFALAGLSVEFTSGYAQGDGDGTVVVAGGTANFLVSSSGDYANSAGGDLVSVATVDLTVATLGINGSSLATQGGAQTALTAIDSAIDKVNDAIGTLGAAQSRFEYASANVSSTMQNVIAAESVIRDADMAFEMTQFTKNQILQQAGTAMLAQANSAPQSILSLIRG